jgi:hypothetical protein
MNPILNSLKALSAAANEVLPLLETHDYREEAKHVKDAKLPLRMMPKTIQEIFNSVMRYIIPVMGDEDPLPGDALLTSDNMTIFSDNLTVTGDTQLAHQFQFVQIEPIQAVADEFTELGLHQQATLLENVCRFARTIRQAHNAAPFGNTGKELAPVHYVLALAPEEMSKREEEDKMLFTQFCSVFVKDIFTLEQKKNLYLALQNVIQDPTEKKPHLVVMTVILLLRTRKMYKNPIPGKLNSVRETVFHALGLDPKSVHTYGDKSVLKGGKPSLEKYKPQAEEILKSTVGN